MNSIDPVATLRERALSRAATPPLSPPSRLLWLVFGILAGIAASVLSYSLGVRVPPLGFGVAVVAKPGFASVRQGMAYEEVVASLGPEDGSVRAAELISYEESVCSWCTRRMDLSAFERSGGRFLFWLSRSDDVLVFNVVALDANNRVIKRWSADDMFFGND